MSEKVVDVNFSSFVMGLAAAALTHLGVMPDPSTGKKESNIEFARQHIEILSMLEEKTRGNLSEDEKRLLASVLTDLRLKFAGHKV